MMSRTAKPISSVMLSALNQIIIGLRDKHRDVWFIGKQSLCMQFIWWLASYAYWIFCAVFVRNSQLAKRNPLNLFGAVTSISGLLIAGRRFGEAVKKKSVAAEIKIGTGMKKAVSLAGTVVRKSGKVAFFRGKLMHDSQMEKQEQPKIEREHEARIETSRAEKPSLNTQEYGHVTPNVSAPSDNLHLSSKGQVFQEIAAECLTCENLIRCDFRSTLSAESGEQFQMGVSCNFANRREIEQIKKQVEQ
jgi:hypothetical protein